jgi:nicotinamide riboside transporter PnuC
LSVKTLWLCGETKMSILQIIIVIVALLGAWLNARKNVYGFCLWLISNGYWGIHNIIIGEYAQAILYFIFLGIAIYGIYEWQRTADGNGKNRSE